MLNLENHYLLQLRFQSLKQNNLGFSTDKNYINLKAQLSCLNEFQRIQ